MTNHPAVPPPKVTPNPGQILEEPVETESETVTDPSESDENAEPAGGNA
jgi:hypothetical protein